MTDSAITSPHVYHVRAQVKDKFCLEFNEEEAVQHLQSLIDESVTAVMAVFVERIHKWAQYWRK